MEADQRRFILAMVLSGLIFVIYYVFFVTPTQDAARADAEREVARAEALETPAPIIPRETLVATGERVQIDTPGMSGSFLTTGSRLDDVTLKQYDKTLDPADGKVELLSPVGGERAAFVADNWIIAGSGDGLQTPWAVVSGDRLTPDSPVVLQSEIGGVQVTRTLSIDDRYLLTLSDTLTNTGAQPVALERRGVSRQIGLPDDLTNFFIIQEGPISVLNDSYHDQKYKKTIKKSWTEMGEAGWVGLTDKYWLQAAIAPQSGQIQASYSHQLIDGKDAWDAAYSTGVTTITPGASIQSVGYIFAGAKDRDVLTRYQDEVGITGMARAIDWGAMGLLVRPISWALSWLGKLIGNYGLGIIALTIVIKVLMFPLFNQQYKSQAKMKKVMPEVKKVQERFKEDPMKMRTEMMAIYKKEGVNPAAGCLPIIPTIFVFFALYKSVFINIDLRHEPFIGYIQDLAAREPVSILNGFGLMSWGPDPLGIPFLALGPLALLYGITMSLMYTLTPPAGDPAQAKLFKLMPWLFMFILAPFAAGLLLYWVTNNVLSFLQQWYITRKYKVDTPVDAFLRKITGRADPDPVD